MNQPMPAVHRLLAFSCAAVLALSVARTSATAGAAMSAADGLIIGLVVPSVGPAAKLSAALQTAIETEIGALTPKPVLHVETDRCSSSGAEEAARRLVARGVTLVIGHPCSNAAISAAKVYAAARIPFVAVGARHPDLTDKRAGPLVFRLAGRDDQQTADTVAALGDRIKGRKFAIIHDRTRAQRRLAEAFAAAIRPAAADVQVFPIVAGEKGYDALITALRVRNPDAVYFALFPPEARLVARGLRNTNFKTLYIFTEAALRSAADLDAVSNSAGTIWMQSTFDDHDDLAKRAAAILRKLHANRNQLSSEHVTRDVEADAATRLKPGDIPTLSFKAHQR
ncbi:MAG: ABC transporter substrate-binding protein [Hyphomicrobiaceae bacterium]|nr:ABC transporter substrate-binding protein [Hyphomicrobiaceae bacterium]